MHECVPYFKLPQRGCIPSSADGSTSAASAVPPAARMGGMGASRKSANSLSLPAFPSCYVANQCKLALPSRISILLTRRRRTGSEWWRRQPTSCGWA